MVARRYEISLRLFQSTIHYVTIATVIFLRVKITCYFHVRKLTWYFIGVYVIKLCNRTRLKNHRTPKINWY